MKIQRLGIPEPTMKPCRLPKAPSLQRIIGFTCTIMKGRTNGVAQDPSAKICIVNIAII